MARRGQQTVRVAIVGSRKYPRLADVTLFVEKLAAKYPETIVVSGGAYGVDSEAELSAKQHGLEVISFRPYEYENRRGLPEFSIETVTLGQRAETYVVEKRLRINPPYFVSYPEACYARNGWIVGAAERVIAFHDGRSNGTQNAIDVTIATGKALHVYDENVRLRS